MKSNLEVLVEAYLQLTLHWSRCTPGETCSRVWKSCEQLMKLIQKELEK